MANSLNDASAPTLNALAATYGYEGNDMPDYGNRRMLVYVLNYVHESDSQHFVHVLNLLNRMRTLGWTINLLSEKGGRGITRVLENDVRYLSQDGNPWRLVRLASELINLRRQGHRLIFVRISLSAAIVSGLVARLVGMRSVFWHSTSNFDLDRSKPLIKRIIDDLQMTLALALSHRLVTGPEAMLDYYRKHYGVAREKISLLYNDVDLSRFRAREQSPTTAVSVVNILFVHSLSPSKRLSLYFPSILAAMRRLKQRGVGSRLNIIGDGAERSVIHAQLAEHGPGLDVRLLGKIPNMQISSYYSDADLFIMPSYREGMPRVILEAMAMGLPIVATDAGGTLDLVGEQQRSFVVLRDDPHSFGAKLEELASSPEIRRELAAENRERVKKFSTDSVAAMYDAQLSALIPA